MEAEFRTTQLSQRVALQFKGLLAADLLLIQPAPAKRFNSGL